MPRTRKPDTAGDSDLIWMTEAIPQYHHSRGWFLRRFDDGELDRVQLVGSTKVYIRRSQLEAYIRAQQPKRKPGPKPRPPER